MGVNKLQYRERIASGKCGHCGKNLLSEDSKARCVPCIKRQALNQKGHYQRNRKRHLLWHITRKYGISAEAYEKLQELQGHACAVCRSPESGHKKHLSLHLDHDHATGKVRGLLCHHCNSAVGYLKDSAERALRIAEYLGAKKLAKRAFFSLKKRRIIPGV